MVPGWPLVVIGAVTAILMAFALHHIEEGHVGVYYRVCFFTPHCSLLVVFVIDYQNFKTLFKIWSARSFRPLYFSFHL